MAAVLIPLVLASPTPAQDPKDDALERLLEKVEAPKTDDKPAEPAKPKDDVEPKDKALDSLLEKIGQDDPEPPPPPRQPGPPGETKPPEPSKDKLENKDQGLDEHLEKIQGKKRKPKDQQQQPQGGGKLAEAIDKMRDVEKRLGQPDTGEQTRKKQAEIVQDLDTILKQMRRSSGGGQGRMSRKTQQAGNRRGQQRQQANNGDNPEGAPPMVPRKPPTTQAMVGDKSEWGHLPPELRTELDNIFKELALPSRQPLIERYYMTITKKASERKE